MGSLPLAKAGVGSAVNDTTRQVGGALGVAIIGSVLASTYGSKVGDAVAGQPLPGGVANDAKNSLGFALQTASQIGGPAGNASRARPARRSSTGCTRATWWGRRSSSSARSRH